MIKLDGGLGRSGSSASKNTIFSIGVVWVAAEHISSRWHPIETWINKQTRKILIIPGLVNSTFFLSILRFLREKFVGTYQPVLLL